MDAPRENPRELTRDHVAALDTLRHAKNVFFWLAMISVVAHVGSWYVARHTSALDAAIRVTTLDLGGDATAGPPSEAEFVKADRWRVATESALAIGGFAGRASIVMLVALYMLGLLVNLSARLGGAAGMAKGCVWSLFALAALVPWNRLTAPEVSGIPPAFFSYDDLIGYINGPIADDEAAAAGADWQETVRFAIYPLLLGLVLVVAQLSYRAGYRRVESSPSARLPMREV